MSLFTIIVIHSSMYNTLLCVGLILVVKESIMKIDGDGV